MRQWLTVLCVIALLLYVGLVLDHQDQRAGASPAAQVDSHDRFVM